MRNGTAAADVLAMVLLLQLTVICCRMHQMRKVAHDYKGGNDIQLVKHFINVNVPESQISRLS